MRMKKYRILSYVFGALALILSYAMCIDVTRSYCYLAYAPALNSAPASTALLLMIPYGFAIVICALLAVLFYRKSK